MLPDRTAGLQFNKKGGAQVNTPPRIKNGSTQAAVLGTFGLIVFLFRGTIFRHCFLELLNVHSVPFGGVHENVVVAGSGSLMSRIQPGDLRQQYAKVDSITEDVCLDVREYRPNFDVLIP